MNLESRILNLTDACSTFDADGKRSSIRGQALQMQVGLSLVDSTFCCTTELTVFQYVVVGSVVSAIRSSGVSEGTAPTSFKVTEVVVVLVAT